MRALEIQAVASSTGSLSASGTSTSARPDTASAATARAVLAGESRQPCKLRMRVAQVKADLIRQRETELLMPAAGPGASEVLRLLRPATETGASTDLPVTGDVPLSSPSLATALATGAAFIAGESVPVTARVSKKEAASIAIASELVGMSCIFGSNGEVRNINHRTYQLLEILVCLLSGWYMFSL